MTAVADGRISWLGNKAVHCSGGGSFTALESTGIVNPVSEATQATYALATWWSTCCAA